MMRTKPSFTSPSRASSPTRTPSSRISPVCEVRHPTVSTRDDEYPSSEESTTNSVTPRLPASGSVLAATTAKSAIAPFVMNIFEPVSTQPSPSEERSARVVMPPTSVPAPGSVTASAPMVRPSTAGQSHRSRCSSVPNRPT